MSGRPLVLPIESALLQGVDVADKKNTEERKHRAKNEICISLEHLAINNGPWIKKDNLDIEKNEKHRHQIKLHRKARVAFPHRQHAAFIRHILHFVALAHFPDD